MTAPRAASAARGALLLWISCGGFALSFAPSVPISPHSYRGVGRGATALRLGTALPMSSSDAMWFSVLDPTRLVPSARRPQVENGLRYQSDDWFRNFLSIPRSFVLKRIRFHLMTNMLITLGVILSHMYLKPIDVPITGHTLLAGFLGLLMVFRTNSAYSRFWEARTVLSEVRSTLHDLSLTIVAHIIPHSPKSGARLLEQLLGFPDALVYSCLGGSSPLSDRAKKLLPDANDLSLVPATRLCLEMQKTVHRAAAESATSASNLVEAMHLTEVSHGIGNLVGALSQCEKIVRTPVPWSYSRHTSRFLTLWCGTLPFPLVGIKGWLTLPLVAVVCWCLFGIEEIGHLIEQPFSGDDEDFQSYDIGIPVKDLALRVTAEVKQISELAKVTEAGKARPPSPIPL